MAMDGRPRCIGHGGASALAPANSLQAFALAAELGADMVEVDVRRFGGRLVLAHSLLDACRPGCLELEPALRWLAAECDEQVGVVIDLKSAGIEQAVVDALVRQGLLERAIVASQCRPILHRVRNAAPRVRTAISVAGALSRRAQGWGAWRDAVVAELRTGKDRALMAHRRLVDADLVDRVRDAGAELYAWTVRRPAEVVALAPFELDGIVTGDPRLLGLPRPAGPRASRPDGPPGTLGASARV